MPQIQVNLPLHVLDAVCETLGEDTSKPEAAKVQLVRQAMTNWLRSLYVRGRSVAEERRAALDAEQIT